MTADGAVAVTSSSFPSSSFLREKKKDLIELKLKARIGAGGDDQGDVRAGGADELVSAFANRYLCTCVAAGWRCAPGLDQRDDCGTDQCRRATRGLRLRCHGRLACRRAHAGPHSARGDRPPAYDCGEYAAVGSPHAGEHGDTVACRPV